MAEEDGGGTADGTGAEASNGMRMGVGGEAEDNCLAGEGVGEDGLGVAIGDEADVGDGGGVGSGVEEEGMDRVE